MGDIVLGLDTVAPFAGAWIETNPSPRMSHADTVAPFAGAWIETVVFAQAGV